jgi:chromosome segregation ATPase
MSDSDKLDKLVNTVDQIHQTVVAIETNHGQKLEALFDGLDSTNQRLDDTNRRLDDNNQRLDGVENRLEKLVEDVGEIRQTLGLLKAIASDYETRISKLEKFVQQHDSQHI